MSRSFFRPGNETSSTDDSGSELSDSSDRIELATSPLRTIPRRSAPTPVINLPDNLHTSPSPSTPPRSVPKSSQNVTGSPRSIPPSASQSVRIAPINTHHLDNVTSADENSFRRDILLHTLLEDRCISEALDQLNNAPGNSTLYTKDHPEVRAVADEKYKFMSVHLGFLGLMSTGTPDDQLQPVRQTYREGLEFLSVKGNTKKGPLLRNSASAVSIADSMNTLLTPHTVSPAYQAGFLEMQRAIAASEMPPFLRSLVSHPLLSSTRYAREFEHCGLLGRGGFGKVYMVSHKLDRKHYAVKRVELSPGRMRDIELRGVEELDGLLQEARVLAQLDHPNIVRYYSCWLEYLHKGTSQHGSLIDKHEISDSISGDYSSEYRDDLRHSKDPDIHPHHSMDSLDDDIWDAGAGVQIVFEHSDSAYQEIHSDKDKLDEKERDEEREEEKDDLASLPSSFPHARHRRQSSATVVSVSSKHSNRDDDLEIVPPTGHREDRQLQMISRPRPHAQYYNYQPESHVKPQQPKIALTLHIQMSYHPLTLAEYLSVSSQPSSPPADEIRFGQQFRHCFHVYPSLKIMLSILDGLEYLHSKKLVHRDLKPANIFLSFNQGYDTSSESNNHPASNEFLYSTGSVDVSACQKCQSCCTGAYSLARSTGPILLNARIGDFGLVTDLAQSSNYALKHVGTEIYRPPVMPTISSRNRSNSSCLKPLDPNVVAVPTGLEIKVSKPVEAIPSPISVSQKIDVYSLGIILFELLYPTFTRMERHEKIYELKNEGKFPTGFACALTSATDVNLEPQEKDAELSQEIRKCILRMVERDESKRASCPEVREMIKAMLGLVQSSV